MIEEAILLSLYLLSGVIPVVYNYVIAKRIAKRYCEVKTYLPSTISENIHATSNDLIKTFSSRLDLNSSVREHILKVSSISSTNDGISVSLVIDRERLMELLKKS